MSRASDKVGGMRRLFDISVPRNVASDVNDMGEVAHVFNVDDLKEVVEKNKLEKWLRRWLGRWVRRWLKRKERGAQA